MLRVDYVHVDDEDLVTHRIAPFDIGTTNPKTRERFRDLLYAYSFTHVDSKTERLDPKVCAFNISRFVRIAASDETFNETELAVANLRATKYDYRSCRFALLPNRNWYR